MDNSQVKEDFLEVDQPIPGQSYACMSFISPDKVLRNKEMFMFHKFMTQRCGEFEKVIDDITKKASDDLKNKIDRDLKSKLKLELKYTYEQFKDKYDDFIYKFNTDLQTAFDKENDFQTSVRGVKVRGVYNTQEEAQIRAKVLQRMDRSFNVYVGQVGFWLPWDPQADSVENEEYLEEELNTLMKEYKQNEIRKDMFYEEQKREKQQDAMKQRMENDAKKKELEQNKAALEAPDPWMASKFSNSEESANASEASTTESTETPAPVENITSEPVVEEKTE